MLRMISRAQAAMGFFGAVITFALAGALPAHAFTSYGTKIPNLTNVAGGCDALCHADGGTGSQLYIDFQTSGEDWSLTANYDSDGDGFSNGWELQDPAGTWVGGAQPGDPALVANPTAPLDLPPLPVATVPAAPTAITHTEAAGDNGSELFTVQNVGAVPFEYSITSNDAWMTPETPPAGPLLAGQQDDLLLSFVTNGLAAGLYQGDLTIAIAGIRADRIPLVLVDLTVPEPSAILAGGGALLSLGLLGRRRVGGVRAPRT